MTRPGPPALATNGRPARTHAVMPPSRFSASKPLIRRPVAARSLGEPLRHAATTTCSFGTSARRAASSPSGMCCAPSMWPASHSSCSRTSRRCKPERRLLTSNGSTGQFWRTAGDMDESAVRERLERERADLAATVGRIREWLAVPQLESGGDVALADQHPADVASETEAREPDRAREGLFEDRIALIDEALRHLERGEYGRCVISGEEIPPARLELVPETPYCLEDAEREQQSSAR